VGFREQTAPDPEAGGCFLSGDFGTFLLVGRIVVWFRLIRGQRNGDGRPWIVVIDFSKMGDQRRFTHLEQDGTTPERGFHDGVAQGKHRHVEISVAVFNSDFVADKLFEGFNPEENMNLEPGLFGQGGQVNVPASSQQMCPGESNTRAAHQIICIRERAEAFGCGDGAGGVIHIIQCVMGLIILRQQDCGRGAIPFGNN